MYKSLICFGVSGILVVLAAHFHIEKDYLLSIPLSLVSMAWGCFALIYTIQWDKEHPDA
jgi:hypothetical protein